MKENWTYKKLGEVCTIIGGSTPKTSEKEFWDGPYFWVTPADLNGSMYQGATPRTITQKAVDKTNLSVLPVGTVLLSSRAPIGKVAITTVPMYCNQGFKNVVCPENINNKFIYWFLKSKTEYLNSLGTGATFKEISKKTTESIVIPVPPVEEQERIVEELDLLSGIIEKQKQQLKELDTLAQSIFYDTFGDPITNEKNWPVKKLGETFFTTSGGTPSKSHSDYYDGGNIPWINSGDLHQMYINIANKYITQKGLDNSSAKLFPQGTVLLAMYGATVGEVSILNIDATTNQAICGIYPNDSFSVVFLYFVLKQSKQYFIKMAAGGAQPNISQGLIKNHNLILPPLSLQEEFAEKIEMIEKQKEAIGKSIKETQLLFDYTMDKYFG